MSFERSQVDPILAVIDDAHRRVHAKLTRHEWISWEQKQEAFRLMNFKIYPKQEEICKDPHPIRVVRAGRRSGKTTLAAHEAVATMLMKPNSLGWVIGPTYDLTSRCWDMILEQLDRLEALGYIKYRSRVSTKSQMKVVLDNGAAAEGHTAGGWGEGLQGVGLHWLVMDEIAQIEPWVLLEIVIPAVIQQNGWCFLIGTPLGESWATREAKQAEIREERRGEKSIWREWIFESWYNTFEFPGGRMDPKIIQMERTMTHEAFMEQICALPQRSRYVIYKEFSEEVHARTCPYDPEMPVHLTIDPSTGVNPYAVLAIQDYGKMIKVIDELYVIGQISYDVIEELSSRPWWSGVVDAIVDDAAPQEKEVWRRHEKCQFSVKLAKKPGYIEDSLPLVRNWLRDPMIFNGYTEPMRSAIVARLYPQYDWSDLQEEEKNTVMSHLETEVQDRPEILLSAARLFIDRFRCPNTIDEFRAYSYLRPRKDDRNPKETPIDFKNHACFPDSTRVSTPDGGKWIRDIRLGDLVNTPLGPRRVVACGQTSPAENVFAISAENGIVLRATANHPVYVQGKGFISVDTLTYGDIMVCEEEFTCHQREYPFKEPPTTGIPTLHTKRPAITMRQPSRMANVVTGISIGKFGRVFTERFRKVIRFITSTTILSTMTTTISPAYPKEITLAFTTSDNQPKERGNTSTACGPWPKNGISLRKDAKFIARMPLLTGLKVMNHASTRANTAMKFSSAERPEKISAIVPVDVATMPDVTVDSFTKTASVLGVERPLVSTKMIEERAVPRSALSVTGVAWSSRESVYNVEVEGAHCFFADGILVSNCDALRYWLWKNKKSFGAERLSPSRYAEIA